MKRKFFLIFLIVLSVSCFSQKELPVTWSFATVNQGKHEAELTFTAIVNDGWHIYSQFIDTGGPIPTSFTFTPGKDYDLIGKVIEPKDPVKAFDKAFEMNITYFSTKVVFVQKIKYAKPGIDIKGTLKFMACNGEQCIPPEEVEFNFTVK